MDEDSVPDSDILIIDESSSTTNSGENASDDSTETTPDSENVQLENVEDEADIQKQDIPQLIAIPASSDQHDIEQYTTALLQHQRVPEQQTRSVSENQHDQQVDKAASNAEHFSQPITDASPHQHDTEQTTIIASKEQQFVAVVSQNQHVPRPPILSMLLNHHVPQQLIAPITYEHVTEQAINLKCSRKHTARRRAGDALQKDKCPVRKYVEPLGDISQFTTEPPSAHQQPKPRKYNALPAGSQPLPAHSQAQPAYQHETIYPPDGVNYLHFNGAGGRFHPYWNRPRGVHAATQTEDVFDTTMHSHLALQQQQQQMSYSLYNPMVYPNHPVHYYPQAYAAALQPNQDLTSFNGYYIYRP